MQHSTIAIWSQNLSKTKNDESLGTRFSVVCYILEELAFFGLISTKTKKNSKKCQQALKGTSHILMYLTVEKVVNVCRTDCRRARDGK